MKPGVRRSYQDILVANSPIGLDRPEFMQHNFLHGTSCPEPLAQPFGAATGQADRLADAEMVTGATVICKARQAQAIVTHSAVEVIGDLSRLQ